MQHARRSTALCQNLRASDRMRACLVRHSTCAVHGAIPLFTHSWHGTQAPERIDTSASSHAQLQAAAVVLGRVHGSGRRTRTHAGQRADGCGGTLNAMRHRDQPPKLKGRRRTAPARSPRCSRPARATPGTRPRRAVHPAAPPAERRSPGTGSRTLRLGSSMAPSAPALSTEPSSS